MSLEPRKDKNPVLDDAALTARLRDTLRASERSLDSDMTSRLRDARARAVAAASNPRPRWPWAVAVPATCAAAFAGWMVLQNPLRQPAAIEPAAAAQIEVLEALGSDDTPLTDDDVEFARWLDEAHGKS